MFQHILFPVDFSAQSESACGVVKAWAMRFGARITMLHVFEGAGMQAVENLPVEAELNLVADLAATQLSRFLLKEFEGASVARVQVKGDAGKSIVEYAAAHGVDLIMIPTMGYTRFRQMLLGSVTASVLHDSEVPVWTSAHVAECCEGKVPRNIVCAVDCGPETANVVRRGKEVAEGFGAMLKILHSRPAVPVEFESGIAQGAHHFALSVARQDYAVATAGMEGIPELEILEDASLLQGVRRVVEREDADLLVIGRGRIQDFMGRLRSNSHDLIRLSGCDVLSV